MSEYDYYEDDRLQKTGKAAKKVKKTDGDMPDPLNPNQTMAFYTSVSGMKKYSKEETLELFRRLRAGEVALREELILANMGLVVTACKQTLHRTDEDLIQSGLEWLIDAVDRFDPNRGWAFTGYAYTILTHKYFKINQTDIPTEASTIDMEISSHSQDNLVYRSEYMPENAVIKKEKEAKRDELLQTILSEALNDEEREIFFALHGDPETSRTQSQLARERGVRHTAIMQRDEVILKKIRSHEKYKDLVYLYNSRAGREQLEKTQNAEEEKKNRSEERAMRRNKLMRQRVWRLKHKEAPAHAEEIEAKPEQKQSGVTTGKKDKTKREQGVI